MGLGEFICKLVPFILIFRGVEGIVAITCCVFIFKGTTNFCSLDSSKLLLCKPPEGEEGDDRE